MSTSRAKALFSVLAILAIAAVANAAVQMSVPWNRFDALPPVPPELARQPLPSSADCKRYLWQGALHEQNTRTGFRGCADPEPREVVALGDSYTFGMGVQAEQAWPALIGATNAGVPGDNAPEELRTLRKSLAANDPWIGKAKTLVLGVCENDAWDWAVQYPRWRKIANQYPLLRRFGLGLTGRVEYQAGWDFYSEPTIASWQMMAELAKSRGIRPLAIVLYTPETGTPALARKMESGLREAGWDVIPHAKVNPPSVVSRWEAHPSAAAHRLFAEAIARSAP